MSKFSSLQNAFLELVTGTSKKQQEAIMKTLTKSQLELIAEISFNLLRFPKGIDKGVERRVAKIEKLLKELSRKSLSLSKRRQFIVKNSGKLIDFLTEIKPFL